MKQIPLTQGLFALVDDDVYEWASQFKWFAAKNGNTYYVGRKYYINSNTKKRRNLFLHHCIIGFPLDNMQVDHIDGNGLNNQRSNLRITTVRGNGQNRIERRTKNTSSKYLGVCWHKHAKKWYAVYHLNGKQKSLGYFNTEIEAAQAYENACSKLVNSI